MRRRVVRIGNSERIRIPKPLLVQIGIVDDIEIEMNNNQFIIRPVSNHREGLDDAFRFMPKEGDDSLVIDE